MSSSEAAPEAPKAATTIPAAATVTVSSEPPTNASTEKKGGDNKLTSDFDQDPLLENPALRMAGYAARVSRLVGTAFSKGVRYTAYTSDVGEAFRPVVPVSWVRAGYAISWTYVLTDVGLQVKWAKEKNQDHVRAGIHAAVFQTFGSMLFPAMIIHTVVHQSEKVFHRVGLHNRWFPVSVVVE